MLLPGDALHHLVGGPAGDADGLRRPGHRPGSTSTEKSGGKRRIDKASAPPTFSTFAGSTPREISAEFGALRKLKPKLGKAVAHLILSPGPEDRTLSKDEWKRALGLALTEHGAADAPHAAYLHADTDHPHLHCFFSRVLPSGQVISDSLSYQKNRSASLKITQELQLTPLPNTPSPQAPGDRQVLQNASRRAERNGTPGPEKINVQAVREALGKATTEEDYVLLNAEIGNEIVYLRRGEDQEIYGYKIRRIGSTEWVKASTLAKDLSWPKIAHRFVETDSAKQVQADQVKVEGPTAAPTPAVPARDKYSRAPGALRQILRDGDSANQMPMGARPAASWADKVVPTFDMKKFSGIVGDLDVGPLSKAMLLLSAASINFGLEIIKAIIRFLQWLLNKLGFGLRPVSQNTSGAEQYALGHEPYYLEAQTSEVQKDQTAEEQAAELVLQVVAGLDDNSMLPAGEGRDELIAELEKHKKSAAAEAEANPLDDVFGADMAAPVTQTLEPAQSVAATTAPAVPQKSLWQGFTESVKQHAAAVAAVARASEKDLPIYFDGRSQAWRQRDDAEAGQQKLEADFATWKNAHRVAALVSDPHSIGLKIVEQKKLVAHVAKLVAEAEKKDRDAAALWKNTKSPVVPASLLADEKAAIAALKASRVLLMKKAQQNLQILADYPILKQQKEMLALKLQRLDARFDEFLVDPKTQPKIVNDLEPVLREIHLAVALERARQAPAPDTEPANPDAPRA